MLKKILKITINNLLKHKGVSLIKILGLTLGLTCISIIYVYNSDELNFDTFHNKYSQIYRLLTADKRDGEISADQPAVILQHLLDEYPEIVDGTRIFNWGKSSVKYQDNLFLENRVFLADSNVFKIFDFPILIGDASSALNNPFSMLISESTAKKYFGDKNPIGEVILFDNEYSFTITGIIKDVPTNSHIQFDFLGSFSSLKKINTRILTEWNYSFSYIYLVLNKNIPQKQLDNRFNDFIIKYRGERIASLIKLKLEQLSDIHLRSADTRSDVAIKGNIKFIYAFSSIAILILVIACFNFTTLTLANTRIRAKEIGVRKVNGATRTNIFYQFLIETAIYTSISFCLSILLTVFILPFLNIYIDTNLFLNFSIIFRLLVISLIVVPLFAGGYPAFILSKLKPISIISGDFESQFATIISGKKGWLNIRSIIVLFQIVFATVVLISTILIYKQLKFIDHINLGFNKDNIIVVENPSDDHKQERFNIFKEFASAYANIENVSAASNVPPNGVNQYRLFRLEGMSKDEDIQMALVEVDRNFFNTLESKFIIGNDFSLTNSTGDFLEVIINESAMQAFNITNPIGEKLIGLNNSDPYVISGVINDINFNSLRKKFEPVVFCVKSRANSNIIIKTKTNNVQNTMQVLKKEWERIAPNHVFQYSFMKTNIENSYIKEYKAAFLFSVFACLTIFLTIFGLIGLISFTIESSIKEIVLRRIFGANMFTVNLIFYKKIMGIVLVAILISCPLAYFIIKLWLQEFAYKVNITFAPFLLTSTIIFLLILSCISFLVLKGNKLNIIKALTKQ
ncbi:MAG: FtsX-like permease family protein [Bacteroidales bacterium]|nr:FtsX-like permease family protein [Bacteroidales bacterium]